MKLHGASFLKLFLSLALLSGADWAIVSGAGHEQQLANAAPKQESGKQMKRSSPSHSTKPAKKKQNRRTRKGMKNKRAGKKTAASGMSWVNLHNQYPEFFMLNGARNYKVVALTFDDAPDPRFTPAILDVLAKYDICATFFVVGERAANHPELVHRIIKEGHVIGNHSYDHSVFSTLSMSQFQQQIWKTDGIIRHITGVSPRLIRPPYGELLPKQVAWGKANGFTIVNWDVDSEDWKKNPSSARVLANIRKTLQPGSIILQHAGGGEGQDLSGTINALPVLIEWLQGKGYDLVTLPELLEKKPYR